MRGNKTKHLSNAFSLPITQPATKDKAIIHALMFKNCTATP